MDYPGAKCDHMQCDNVWMSPLYSSLWHDFLKDKSLAHWTLSTLKDCCRSDLHNCLLQWGLLCSQKVWKNELGINYHYVLLFTCLPERTAGRTGDEVISWVLSDQGIAPKRGLDLGLKSKQPQRWLQLFCFYSVQWLLLIESILANLQKAGVILLPVTATLFGNYRKKQPLADFFSRVFNLIIRPETHWTFLQLPHR